MTTTNSKTLCRICDPKHAQGRCPPTAKQLSARPCRIVPSPTPRPPTSHPTASHTWYAHSRKIAPNTQFSRYTMITQVGLINRYVATSHTPAHKTGLTVSLVPSRPVAAQTACSAPAPHDRRPRRSDAQSPPSRDVARALVLSAHLAITTRSGREDGEAEARRVGSAVETGSR